MPVGLVRDGCNIRASGGSEWLVCDYCGGDTIVTSTIQAYDIVIRYHKCKLCRSKMKTAERIQTDG